MSMLFRSALFCVSVAAASAVQATVVVDQSTFEATSQSGGAFVGQDGFPEKQSALQTFTVGQNGTLASLGLKLFTYPNQIGSLQVSVFDHGENGEGAQQYSGALYVGDIALSSLPQYNAPSGPLTYDFDLSGSDIIVHVGEVMSFMLTGDQPYGGSTTRNSAAAVGTNSSYAGGRGYLSGNWGLGFAPAPANRFTNIEFQTLVNVAGVPEPAAWAMMIVGFGAIGGAMRRRRAAATPSVRVAA